jgi:hypothetical protein
VPPRLHELQKPLDRLIRYMTDARHIYATIQKLQLLLSDERKQKGNSSAAGHPGKEHKSLNRAVVVATVGAMEAFFEDLTITALEARPLLAPPQRDWFPIAGSRGMIQTPSPFNVRKLLWTYFNMDPIDRWDILVTCEGDEINAETKNNTSIKEGKWRGHSFQYSGTEAAGFVDAMVKVRHGFAHQDNSIRTVRKAGILTLTKSGSISVQSHHAFNAMSGLVQIAIITTMHLAEVLEMDSREFRWPEKLAEVGHWVWLLHGTPAGDLVDGYWRGAPDLVV